MGLLVVAATIAVFAPASLVDARVASISRGTLRIADAQGTLWRGHGVLTPPDGRWRVPVEWTLRPLPLLGGATSIELTVPEGAAQGVRGRIELRASRALADSLVVRVPATAVTSMSGPSALQPGGDLELSSDALELAPTGSSGSVAAHWRNARLVGAGLPVLDFGTLTAKLTMRGNALAGPVTSQGGMVLVSGNVSVGAERIAADLRLLPDASAPPELHKALATFGPVDASGAILVRVDRSTR